MAARRMGAVVFAAACVTLTACGADDGETVAVFAAASLADAFGEIATAFEAANPGVDVGLSHTASSSLREQVLAGAPADVFASADTSNMDVVVESGIADRATPFATNRLRLVVPSGNPADVTTLADLADPDLLIGLCAAEAPCGRFGREALASAGVTPAIDTNEPDVRSLLTKIEAGELDAGIVYVTDVIAAGDVVEGIDIPDEHDVVAVYPIAALTDEGDEFVAFVLSDAGQGILRAHGFGAP